MFGASDFGAADPIVEELSSVDPSEVEGVMGDEMAVVSESVVVGDSSAVSARAEEALATSIARVKLNSLHSNGGVAPCSSPGEGLNSAPSSSEMMRVWNVGTVKPAVRGRLEGRRIVERGESSTADRVEDVVETGAVARRSRGRVMSTQVPTFFFEAMSIVPPF